MLRSYASTSLGQCQAGPRQGPATEVMGPPQELRLYVEKDPRVVHLQALTPGQLTGAIDGQMAVNDL